MSYENLISKTNLLLAWRRITTTKDARYKQFFRHIYEAYELSFEDNIVNLRQRLRDRIYQPHEPVRIYYPKSSGLQRPITLLCIEDQILLQALANLFAEKIRGRRQPLIGKSVFSNWLTRKGDSVFFLSDWKYGYNSLRRKLIDGFNTGYTWVANVDLSAFYETIPHDLLLKTIHPRGGGPRFIEEVSNWLKVWSSDVRSTQHKHGIPQGPKASDFLAECIMIPIDERITRDYLYLRYVDDIRILGRTELEVRQALVYLDILCRERGLIPNADKTRIKQVSDAEELVSDMPNVLGYIESGENQELDAESSEELLSESISRIETNIQVTDRSKLRYLLFRAPQSDKILNLVIDLWSHSPENIDAFVVFLENYNRAEQIVTLCKDLLEKKFPNDFIRGEMWKLLARMSTVEEMQPLIELAIDTVRNTKKGSAARSGAYAFLCKCECMGIGNYSRWMMWEKSPILQAISAPFLEISPSKGLEAAKQMLRRSLPDPSLAITRNLIETGLTLDTLGISKAELAPIVQNVYHESGILPIRPSRQADPIGEILNRRYGAIKWGKWHSIFGGEYQFALMLLTIAESYYDSQLSPWLAQQDSFNDALFRAFQVTLARKFAVGAIKVVDANGRQIDYGNLICNGTFMRNYSTLAGHLQAVHDRRIKLPTSHPYEKRTGAKAKPLRKSEQREMIARLRVIYSEIIRIAQTLCI
jgi:retron-type reverse transcriptase